MKMDLPLLTEGQSHNCQLMLRIAWKHQKSWNPGPTTTKAPISTWPTFHPAHQPVEQLTPKAIWEVGCRRSIRISFRRIKVGSRAPRLWNHKNKWTISIIIRTIPLMVPETATWAPSSKAKRSIYSKLLSWMSNLRGNWKQWNRLESTGNHLRTSRIAFRRLTGSSKTNR